MELCRKARFEAKWTEILAPLIAFLALVAAQELLGSRLVKVVDPRHGEVGFRPILKLEAVEFPTPRLVAVPSGNWPIPKRKPEPRLSVPADS